MKKATALVTAVFLLICLSSCQPENRGNKPSGNTTEASESVQTKAQTFADDETSQAPESETQSREAEPQSREAVVQTEVESISWNPGWEFAEYSVINSGSAKLYRAQSDRKNITVCVNAGHGTKGGSSVKTYCHPDRSPKCVTGSTAAGETMAVAVGGGTTLLDGTPESKATLSFSLILRDKLLEKGYDVLMIRESDDVQLDNVARTVMANNLADCHISIHYDSTENDKGMFIIGVPEIDSYLKMEPVASHYKEHNALGDAIISGARQSGVKVFSNGYMRIDLTQTSYSTVPSAEVEVGDRKSDCSAGTQSAVADAIVRGIDIYFGQ